MKKVISVQFLPSCDITSMSNVVDEQWMCVLFLGETVLHVAAIKGDYQLAKTSIEKGLDIHSRDYCGWQPLHEACNHGNLAIVELLLDSGADINDPGGPHCRGMTPLHDAVQNAHVDVVKLLVSRGASVSQRNKDGHTPLDIILHASQGDDEDDDEDDPEVAEVREQLTRILRSATNSRKSQPTALRRRDKLELSDDSDIETLPDLSGTTRTEEISRKRKSSLLDLDSDEDDSSRSSINLCRNKGKSAKVSKNSVLGSDDESQNRYDGKVLESQDRTSEISDGTIFRNDSDHSETSRDSISDLDVVRDNSEDLIGLDSDPIDVPNLICVDPVTGGTQKESPVSESQPALIPENEYMSSTDGWLVDDMPKKSGKRKRSGNLLSMLGGSVSPHDNLCKRSNSSYTVNRKSDNSRRVSSTQRAQGISTGRSRNRLRQSRLNVMVSSSTPNEFLDNTPSEDATTLLSSGVASFPDVPMRLRVKVKDKMFLIPCPNVSGERKTIKWLAEQVSWFVGFFFALETNHSPSDLHISGNNSLSFRYWLKTCAIPIYHRRSCAIPS